MCGERDDMYTFTATFLKEKAPGRPLSSVNIVSADGFFDQNMVIGLDSLTQSSLLINGTFLILVYARSLANQVMIC